ncbi:MAG: DNA-binding protein, partial [Levilactobacillus sp.]|nr:DNA-binding protein [Levilactobacillus sp.]
RTEKILEDYEAKLHLYQEFTARNAQADEIQAYVAANYPQDAKLNRLVAGLENLEEQ